ncbi:MAG: formimidoylglutamase [Owenweeksia sp.]
MLSLFSSDQKERLTATRKGETKIGEKVQLLLSLDDLESTNARFVLLGFKEDIGIRANLGKGGAANAWDYALPALLNIQENRFFSGSELCIAGSLDFNDLMEQAMNLNPAQEQDLKKLRDLTVEVDEQVSALVEKIVSAGKIPILIGGGHNNAYGNIKGTSKAIGKALNALNIDPHTDYRSLEGRHSGNGFRYAHSDGSLGKYAVFGLHEDYNGEAVLQDFDKDERLTYLTYESLLTQTFEERDRHFKNTLQWLSEAPMGLELDLDALSFFPVSALNPSGFSLPEMRHFIRTASALIQPRYFHICEGSPGRAAHENDRQLLGKSIAYLVTDFIKSYYSA